MTVGCYCAYNTTYGFELLLEPESPRHVFQFLMCRNINLNPTSSKILKGIIYDNGCNFLKYLLNREPREFQYLRALVDGSHWHGHKSLRKPSQSSKGHIGCSEGFNINLYKHQMNGYSQGREQMHSILTNLSKSIRSMSYRNSMISLKTFFALLNLKNRGDLQ